MGVIDQKITKEYAIYNADCIEVMKSLPKDSIHFSLYSPPFGGLYNYSSDPRDMSNCLDKKQFLEHYEYVVTDKHRITIPGRCSAVHCTDILSDNSGKGHLIDLPGDIISLHEKHGWRFIARHVIWKDPLWIRNKTMAKALAHRTIVEDSTYAGVASADYLLVFRKNGANKIPIMHKNGFDHYAGKGTMPAEILKYKNWKGNQVENRFSHFIWQRYASSIWDDINIGRILPFRDCKEPDDEKHVHPLQLDIIERAISLRTNPGEVVFTPFMGVGSEPYMSVTLGRMGMGVELKKSYYRQAVANMLKAKLHDYGMDDAQLKIDMGDSDK